MTKLKALFKNYDKTLTKDDLEGLVKIGASNVRDSLSMKRSQSPDRSSKFGFAPQSNKILPTEKFQEIFLSCIESVLKARTRTELYD